jgi:7-keto-8-aminopelargonate synthetase-like enzyme
MLLFSFPSPPPSYSSKGAVAQVDGKEVVSFCSCDFLGTSKREKIMVREKIMA